ncbi:hypothetical protein NIES3974_06850 [Calothrix sp. NIES-3974]|nr:hypothetical protein [Calothrix sp. NIES-3974]BAZ04055.1 hypothetical protein NIES3974_06850 [Calothrix sp. NIES-3974]
MSQSSKLNQKLTQIFGMFLGIAIAVWVMRGFGIPFLTALPGGLILLLFVIAITFGVLSYLQKTWWRF